MEMVKRLECLYRGPWIKINFYQQIPPHSQNALKNLNFCEALNEAKVIGPIIIDLKKLTHPGERFVFLREGNHEEVYRNCQKAGKGVNKEKFFSLISAIPQLHPEYRYIGLEMENEADIYLSHLPPSQLGKLIWDYHTITGQRLKISLTGILGVCGEVTVGSFIKQNITIALTCEVSRQKCSIPRETFVVGVPHPLAKKLLEGKR